MVEPATFIAIDAALRGAMVATLLLLSTGVVRGHDRSLVARSWVMLAIGLSIQTVAASPEVELGMDRLWQSPLVAVSVGNGVLFWIFARTLFDDDFRPGPGPLLFWIGVALASGINCALGPALSPWLRRILELVQRATPLLCAVLVVAAVGSQWAADLVERRRSLRAFITVGGVIYSIALLGLRLSTPAGTLSPPMALIDTSILLLLVAGVAISSLLVQSPELFGPVRNAVPGANSPTSAGAVIPPLTGSPEPAGTRAAISSLAQLEADQLLSAGMVARINAERLYAQADLSVASLAAKLAVPEYRLRRTINQALGFRNFNAFVNSLRLTEARQALQDPARRHLPILSIALETGFQSIGPFNRSFKSATGLTPSEFREKNSAETANLLAESSNSSFRRDARPLQS